jgi:Enoyl-CoA hydratase/isomerase
MVLFIRSTFPFVHGYLGFSQPMVDVASGAGVFDGVRPEWLLALDQAVDLRRGLAVTARIGVQNRGRRCRLQGSSRFGASIPTHCTIGLTISVKFEKDGRVAIATFASRPMNLLTIELIEAFGDAAQAALDANARAFLTLAEGDHLCGGANVFSNFVGKDSNFGRQMLGQAFAVTRKVERLPIPTVVAVRGLCLGGGCELMQLHDIVFVGEGARISQAEAQLATSTLLGGASRLVSKIGAARAKEMSPPPISMMRRHSTPGASSTRCFLTATSKRGRTRPQTRRRSDSRVLLR